MRYRVEIEYHTPLLRRWRSSLNVVLSLAVSAILIIAAWLFLVEKVVPMFQDAKDLRGELQQEKSKLQALETDLGRLQLSGPFQQQWQARAYSQFARLCTSPQSAYQRFLLLEKTAPVELHIIEINPEKKGPGYRFAIELSGTYDAILRYLEQLEVEFQYWRINSMRVWPEFAEKQYEGFLHAKLDGWLW